jgi:uncharacterized damage-inducible protein DinB
VSTAPREIRTTLVTPDGFRSREVARFMWMIDEQRRQLIAETRGLTPAQLEWQLGPGSNTIGMLLAHIAQVEVHLGQVGLLGEAAGHTADVVGLGEAEVGIPLDAGAPPAPALAGKDLAAFDDLLARARAHTARVARDLTDEDLAVDIVRPPRPDGSQRVFDRAWVLHHLIEHEAQHRGQINLLRRLVREAKPPR